MSAAIKGRPALMASSSVTPKDAIEVGTQTTLALAYQSGRPSRIGPANTTSAAASAGTSARCLSRNGPPPTTSRRAPGIRGRARRKARSRRSKPLRGSTRPTNRTLKRPSSKAGRGRPAAKRATSTPLGMTLNSARSRGPRAS